ncbi:histidine triad nucleotide-binding protein [Dolichospermum sp. ST_sed1]|nr:histidine triad nucleotide-binding protein [Dolichospermum sp. ST_sed1]
MNTIFDSILKGEIPCNKVYEDDHVLAFHDVNPQAPVHVLVIPKQRFQGFANLKDGDTQVVGHYFQAISKVADILGLESNGNRVVLNNGSDGGQTVAYIHAHILAGRPLRWPPS